MDTLHQRTIVPDHPNTAEKHGSQRDVFVPERVGNAEDADGFEEFSIKAGHDPLLVKTALVTALLKQTKEFLSRSDHLIGYALIPPT